MIISQYQYTKNNQYTKNKQQTTMKKTFNLEDRTLEYAESIIRLSKGIAKDLVNRKILDQLIRSAGSVGANYREASESLSKKDFLHKMKITRKECKESTYWLELLKENNQQENRWIEQLMQESKELRNIFSAIINKSAQ